MKYLVTGGCGFIGSHLVDGLCESGHDVIILDDLSTGKISNISHDVEIAEGCITKKDNFDNLLADVDGVFHLAAIASVERSRNEWEWSHRVNLGGMINLLDAVASMDKKVPIVYASSAAVYGSNQNLPLGVESFSKPLTAYGADKLGCEQHALVGANVHGISSVGLRFFNVYGPRQDPSSPYSGVISIFADKIKSGEEITFFGDGRQTRDFVYVADIVKALVAAMDLQHRGIEPLAKIIPVCTGESTSLLLLAETMEAITGNKVSKKFEAARIGDIRGSLGDSSCMKKNLGVEASVSIAEGLELTLG